MRSAIARRGQLFNGDTRLCCITTKCRKAKDGSKNNAAELPQLWSVFLFPDTRLVVVANNGNSSIWSVLNADVLPQLSPNRMSPFVMSA